MNILNTKQWIITLILCVVSFVQAKKVYVNQSSPSPTAPYTNADNGGAYDSGGH